MAADTAFPMAPFGTAPAWPPSRRSCHEPAPHPPHRPAAVRRRRLLLRRPGGRRVRPGPHPADRHHRHARGRLPLPGVNAGPGDLLTVTPDGLFCPAGGFHIDPWRPVARAGITHAHGDHAHAGSRSYLTAASGASLVRLRVDAEVQELRYGEEIGLGLGDVRLSLHPAGHLLGSAQVRIAARGSVWVVSGDYKTVGDPTCDVFTPVPCDVFVTESTFGLPIYRWLPSAAVFDDVHAWWRANQEQQRTSVLFAYALGKAQRLLAGLDRRIGPRV